MNKKIIGLSVIVIVIGIIIIAVKGFNVNLKYKNHKVLQISLGQDFDVKDIKSITDEVLGKKKVIIEKAGLFNDSIRINVEDISEEQIKSLEDKINEKYGIANNEESKEESSEESSDESTEANSDTSSIKISVSSVGRVTLKDMAKQYWLYVVIATIAVVAYFAIIYRNLGVVSVIGKSIALIVLAELLFISIIAIVRYPIDKLVIMAALAIYIVVITYLNKMFNEQKQIQNK